MHSYELFSIHSVTGWQYCTSIGSIELDAEVSIRSSGVVTGCKDNSTNSFDLPDHTRHSWCRHDAILTNYETTHLSADIDKNIDDIEVHKCSNWS